MKPVEIVVARRVFPSQPELGDSFEKSESWFLNSLILYSTHFVLAPSPSSRNPFYRTPARSREQTRAQVRLDIL